MIDMSLNVPQHISIIMDGNGRWAKKRKLPRSIGHYAGMLALRNVIWDCNQLGVKYLTVYAFSTENWTRPQQEVEYLTNGLPREAFNSKILDLYYEKNIKVTFLGEINKLTPTTLEHLRLAEEKTKNNDGLHLNFAMNYGGRNDILNAIIKCIKDNTVDEANISEEEFSGFLYTKGIRDPDLVIRTGGDYRISNFLLWQIANSELWFTEKYWPSFQRNTLLEAIKDYNDRKRNGYE